MGFFKNSACNTRIVNENTLFKTALTSYRFNFQFVGLNSKSKYFSQLK